MTIIAAISKNRVIGLKNDLPWFLPEDQKWFKDMTKGKTLIMGRRTFESLKNPLENRNIIIISRDKDFKPAYGIVKDSLKEAIDQNPDAFIVGGGEIYKQTIDIADEMYITSIDKEFDGDTFFPEIDMSKWKIIDEKESFDKNANLKYSFIHYKRAL